MFGYFCVLFYYGAVGVGGEGVSLILIEAATYATTGSISLSSLFKPGILIPLKAPVLK